MILKIEPKYKVRNALIIISLSIGLALILLDILLKETNGLYFFSIIMFAVGGFIAVFSSKSKLIINSKSITFETKNIIDGAKTTKIDFEDIEKVYFLIRQFLLLGGRNPLADADAQTLYHTNRIVMETKDKKEKVIPQVGKLKKFKNAFAVIERKTSHLSN